MASRSTFTGGSWGSAPSGSWRAAAGPGTPARCDRARPAPPSAPSSREVRPAPAATSRAAFHHAREPICLGGEHRHALAHFLRTLRPSCTQGLREEPDTGQRRAQLVRDVRHESPSSSATACRRAASRGWSGRIPRRSRDTAARAGRCTAFRLRNAKRRGGSPGSSAASANPSSGGPEPRRARPNGRGLSRLRHDPAKRCQRRDRLARREQAERGALPGEARALALVTGRRPPHPESRVSTVGRSASWCRGLPARFPGSAPRSAVPAARSRSRRWQRFAGSWRRRDRPRPWSPRVRARAAAGGIRARRGAAGRSRRAARVPQPDAVHRPARAAVSRDRRGIRPDIREMRRAYKLSRIEDGLRGEHLGTKLRTPLTGVRLFAETLRAGKGGRVRRKCASAWRCSPPRQIGSPRMVEKLLDWSRLEAGRTSLELERTEVPALLDRIGQAYRAQQLPPATDGAGPPASASERGPATPWRKWC